MLLNKLVPTAVIALAFAVSASAQQSDSSTNQPAESTSTVSAPAMPGGAPSSAKPADAAYWQAPKISFSAGFSYLQTDLLDTPGVQNTYSIGWYAMPQYHFTRHLSAIAEFDDLGNYHANASENERAFLGGPEWTFGPRHHVQPFVFAEGGAVRDSRDGYVNWMASTAGGVGVSSKLSRSISFQLIPAEYVASKQTDGEWSGSFMAKAGVTFTGFHLK